MAIAMWSETFLFSSLIVSSVLLAIVNCQSSPGTSDVQFNNNGPWLEVPHWANEDQFPHHITIKTISPTDGRQVVCSGALLTLSRVLTSASCVIRGQFFLIRSGTITHYTDGEHRTSFNVQIHPFYNPANNSNDAALITLERPLANHNNTIIALPNAQIAAANITERLAIVAGYGQDLSGELSPVLTYSHVQIEGINSANCRRLTSHQSTTQFRCATVFVNQRTRGKCFGDRGSPLIALFERRWILLGISVYDSESNNCENSTNLYTDVYSLRQWIAAVTGLNIQ